ncbi:MAG TPA: UDP-N-acetylmuramoyl-L-alanine--D-glutamate ligase, partial [Acidimicrobiia bacterium]|nr:UDP-N-acetylmuramoyl-L-alanine--D-glutamate ligase [Acidimicrobiia bacterium]
MKALLIGAAVSGRAALHLLEADGYEVVVYDADPAAVADLGAGRRVQGGSWDPTLLAGVDLVVTSPGVPPDRAPLVDALLSGVPLWGELEFASRHLAVPLLAVTATNGKTTITQMATAMLAASGRRVAAMGNVGIPLSEAVGGDW